MRKHLGCCDYNCLTWEFHDAPCQNIIEILKEFSFSNTLLFQFLVSANRVYEFYY